MGRRGEVARRVAAVLVLAAACGGPELAVQVTRHPEGFGAHRTYRWRQPPAASVPGQAPSLALRTDWAIRQATDRRLDQKGWRRAEREPADVVLAYDLRLHDETSDSFMEFLAYKRAGGRKDFGQAYIDGFEQATLTLQAADDRDERVLWHGEVTGLTDPERSGENIPRAVDALLDRFPDGG